MGSGQNKMGLEKGTIGTPAGLRRNKVNITKTARFASLGHCMVRCIESVLSMLQRLGDF